MNRKGFRACICDVEKKEKCLLKLPRARVPDLVRAINHFFSTAKSNMRVRASA
jgi:hypothetical protein